jgi:hypothetical protein
VLLPQRQAGILPLPQNTIAFQSHPLGRSPGLGHLAALFNHFISDIPVPIPNIASYADDLTIFVSSPRLNAAEAELDMLLRTVSDWSAEKKLGLAPGKSSVTFFTPGTHQSRYRPSATICNGIIPLDKTPKILGVTWDTHFTFSSHARAIAAKATGSLRISKPLLTPIGAFPRRRT